MAWVYITRWSNLARSGYRLCPARKIYHVLIKLVQPRWLDICLVFLRVYGPRLRLNYKLGQYPATLTSSLVSNHTYLWNWIKTATKIVKALYMVSTAAELHFKIQCTNTDQESNAFHTRALVQVYTLNQTLGLILHNFFSWTKIPQTSKLYIKDACIESIHKI